MIQFMYIPRQVNAHQHKIQADTQRLEQTTNNVHSFFVPPLVPSILTSFVTAVVSNTEVARVVEEVVPVH